jgi:prepilin-type N-terminal cleavage/methylation domain-containing protein
MAVPAIRSPRDGCNDKGFTLVEMTIVVVLMGILMTLGMAVFDAQLSNAASSGTRKNQEILKEALIAYLRDNKRLPCPETSALGGMAPTGRETRQSAGDPATSCASYWGTVPYTTLGLPRDTAIDGFGNLFTYFVSSAQSTAEPDWTLTQKSGVPGFSVGNPGRFGITDNGVATTLSANLAVAAFVSHGKNGLGAYTIKGTRNELPAGGTEERTNAPDAAALPGPWNPPSTVATLPPTLPEPGVAMLVARDRTETFDDIDLAMHPNDLLQPLVKDGAIRSAEAQIQEALLAVKGMAVAQLLGNACKPVASLSSTTRIDPWGQPIAYGSTATTTTLTSTTPPNPAATFAFQVWSYGPDRANNNGAGDDRILPSGHSVSFAEVRSLIPPIACP